MSTGWVGVALGVIVLLAAPPADAQSRPNRRSEVLRRVEEAGVARTETPRSTYQGVRVEPEDATFENWTRRDLRRLRGGIFPSLLFGTLLTAGSLVGAAHFAGDSTLGGERSQWVPVAAVPIFGPWIRLVDPHIESYLGPVAVAVGHLAGLSLLVAGICMLELAIRVGAALRGRADP